MHRVDLLVKVDQGLLAAVYYVDEAPAHLVKSWAAECVNQCIVIIIIIIVIIINLRERNDNDDDDGDDGDVALIDTFCCPGLYLNIIIVIIINLHDGNDHDDNNDDDDGDNIPDICPFFTLADFKA